jgi:hypothetical protein
MKTPRLGAALAYLTLTAFVLACEGGRSPSGPAAAKADRSAASFSQASTSDQKYRWDIIHIVNGSPISGGMASAKANDGSKITFTGSGTFQANNDDEVTGGGTWQTFSSSGTSTGSGSYRVTGLVSFELAPGTLPAFGADTRAGLAILRIAYSNGSRGILVVSCNLGGPGTQGVFEGITASMGFVDYWNRVEHNFTLFRALSGEDD